MIRITQFCGLLFSGFLFVSATVSPAVGQSASALAKQAAEHIYGGNGKEAITKCDAALKIDPKENNCLIYRGLGYAIQGNMDLALTDLLAYDDLKIAGGDTAFVRINTDIEWGWLPKGILGRVPAYQAYAQGNFRRAIQIYPKFARAYLRLGESLLNEAKYAESMQNSEKYISMAPSDPAGYITYVNAASDLKNYDAVIKVSTVGVDALKSRAESYYLYFIRGSAYFNTNNYSAAIKDLTSAIDGTWSSIKNRKLIESESLILRGSYSVRGAIHGIEGRARAAADDLGRAWDIDSSSDGRNLVLQIVDGLIKEKPGATEYTSLRRRFMLEIGK